MDFYSVRDVERVLRLPRSTIRGLVDLGCVSPARGPRREYRFSFQDLIVLRAARALMQAKVPRRRIRRALEDLRRHLPERMPLSGLSICAVGDRVVVRDGKNHWQADSGQYLLGLEVSVEGGVLQMVEHAPAAVSTPAAGTDCFDQALACEQQDPHAALKAYERAVKADPTHLAAWINWGRLLHELGEVRGAEAVYRRALQSCGPDAVLLFNLGVALEDLDRPAAALEAYQGAICEDPELADGHYNLARLYESMGKPQHAIRHLGQYRRLVTEELH